MHNLKATVATHQPAQLNAVKHRHPHDECDIIGELMGHYGKYQFFMTFLLSLFQVPNTFHISSPIYQVSRSIEIILFKFSIK